MLQEPRLETFHQPQSFHTLLLTPSHKSAKQGSKRTTAHPTWIRLHSPEHNRHHSSILYTQTGDVTFTNFSSELRPSTSHRSLDSQPASPHRTIPPRRQDVFQCVVWHHRSNQPQSYAPWRLCECDPGSVSEISSYAQQTQASASAQ